MQEVMKIVEVHWTVAFGLCAVVFVGCGGRDGVQRVELMGAVTYKGEPVAEGSILFAPSDGTEGPSIAVIIANGNYRTDSQGGIPLGNYRVEILGYRANAGGKRQMSVPQLGPGSGDAHPNAPQQYLPEKYNAQTQLKIKVEADPEAARRDFALVE